MGSLNRIRSIESVVAWPAAWRMALRAAHLSTMLMITPPNTDGLRNPLAWWGIMRSAITASEAIGDLGAVRSTAGGFMPDGGWRKRAPLDVGARGEVPTSSGGGGA